MSSPTDLTSASTGEQESTVIGASSLEVQNPEESHPPRDFVDGVCTVKLKKSHIPLTVVEFRAIGAGLLGVTSELEAQAIFAKLRFVDLRALCQWLNITVTGRDRVAVQRSLIAGLVQAVSSDLRFPQASTYFKEFAKATRKIILDIKDTGEEEEGIIIEDEEGEEESSVANHPNFEIEDKEVEVQAALDFLQQFARAKEIVAKQPADLSHLQNQKALSFTFINNNQTRDTSFDISQETIDTYLGGNIYAPKLVASATLQGITQHFGWPNQVSGKGPAFICRDRNLIQRIFSLDVVIAGEPPIMRDGSINSSLFSYKSP